MIGPAVLPILDHLARYPSVYQRVSFSSCCWSSYALICRFRSGTDDVRLFYHLRIAEPTDLTPRSSNGFISYQLWHSCWDTAPMHPRSLCPVSLSHTMDTTPLRSSLPYAQHSRSSSLRGCSDSSFSLSTPSISRDSGPRFSSPLSVCPSKLPR